MLSIASAAFWAEQLEYLIRLILSVLCGAAIGYERENRLKEAGIRTHLIVSLASALMMVVSKYGFFDVVVYESINLDPSRVAAGIVTGVGFLGTGTIFVRKQTVSGLTTAAGVWATMGVGMAIGGGMYVLGVAGTLLIILSQILLHRNLRWPRMQNMQPLIVHLADSPDAVDYLQDTLAKKHIHVAGMKAEKTEKGFLKIRLIIHLPNNCSAVALIELFRDNGFIESVEV